MLNIHIYYNLLIRLSAEQTITIINAILLLTLWYNNKGIYLTNISIIAGRKGFDNRQTKIYTII